MPHASVNDNSSLTLVSPYAIDTPVQSNSARPATPRTSTSTRRMRASTAAGISNLSNSTANIIAVTQSGDQLTNFDNTISGAGTIGTGGMVLVNDGVINADQQSAALTLDPAFLANTGTLEATKGATLVFSNTTVSNSSVTTEAPGSYSFNNAIQDPAAAMPPPESGFFNTGFFGINDAGQVVGFYSSGGPNGFLYNGSDFVPIDDPLANGDPLANRGTRAIAINDTGEVVGSYYSAAAIQVGFLYSNGTYITLSDPLGVNGSLANGINNAGQIVGEYIDARGSPHAFVFSNGSYTTLNDPLGVNGAYAEGINDAGQIVGYYLDSSSVSHGFLYSNGTYVTLNDPSAAGGTYAEGINDAGQVVGYYLDASNVAHGFVYSNGTYFNFDNSAAGAETGQGTFALAINNAGEVSGYTVGSGFAVAGFVATPMQSPTSGSIFADSGATIDLVGSNIVGGDLTTAAATNTSAAGLIDVTGNAISAIYDATVNNSGAFSIEQGSQLNVSGTAFAGGTIDDGGTLSVTADSTIENATINGGGAVTMDTGVTLTLDAVTLDNVTLSGSVDNTATLTIDPTVTLHGATIDGGTIDVTGKLLVQDGDTATIDVNTVTVESGAIIQADCSALTISENQPGSANSGTIEATNGGLVTLNHILTYNNDGTYTAATATTESGGVIKADDATVIINGLQGDANYGTLEAVDRGIFTINVSYNPNYTDGGGNFGIIEALSAASSTSPGTC